jgi:hypothetical protein
MPRGIGSELCVSTPCAEPVRGTLAGLYLSRDVLLGAIAMPRGIDSELCGFTPCAEPVCGTPLGSVDMGVLGDMPLFRMTMPLGIGSELWVFKPCAEPVSGTEGASDANVGFGELGWAQPLMARMEIAIMAGPVTCLLEIRILISLPRRRQRSKRVVYPVHVRIRKSSGEMTRKLSDTASQ